MGLGGSSQAWSRCIGRSRIVLFPGEITSSILTSLTFLTSRLFETVSRVEILLTIYWSHAGSPISYSHGS